MRSTHERQATQGMGRKDLGENMERKHVEATHGTPWCAKGSNQHGSQNEAWSTHRHGSNGRMEKWMGCSKVQCDSESS